MKNDLKGQFCSQNGLYICEFKIHGPNWQNVSTANNEGNLYCKNKNIYKNWIQIVALPKTGIYNLRPAEAFNFAREAQDFVNFAISFTKNTICMRKNT